MTAEEYFEKFRGQTRPVSTNSVSDRAITVLQISLRRRRKRIFYFLSKKKKKT